jgi:hypothetical protein
MREWRPMALECKAETAAPGRDEALLRQLCRFTAWAFAPSVRSWDSRFPGSAAYRWTILRDGSWDWSSRAADRVGAACELSPLNYDEKISGLRGSNPINACFLNGDGARLLVTRV